MWLLDANMDVHLESILRDLGISCETAAARGWKALSNGELVTAAVTAGFTCLLTRDQLRLLNCDEWFARQVEEGLSAAECGEFVEHEEVGKLIDSRYLG